MINYEIPITETNDVITNDSNYEYNNMFEAMVLDYDLNFNLKYINLICDYYKIKKNRLNKQQLIVNIVNFEIDTNNFYEVEKRKRLFDNFIELKNNKFFSKFIISN